MLEKVTTDPQAGPDMLFEAYSLKSAVLLNMHQFKDAFDVAQKGVAINSYNSGIYGALVDADVELGHYDSAVANCDRMLALRPDLRSYSRASYLRQIHGDNRGAIDAMRMAVEAGLPGAEQTEWARVTLGDLYLNTGHADTAALLYQISLQYRPGYPYALLGQARVARLQKQYDTAIAITEQAIKAMSDPGFIAFLSDTYELQGNADKALSIRKQIIKGMNKGQEAEKDALVKHNANREMANAYLAIGDLDQAAEYAAADLRMRPDNIDANELMAWILYRKGDYAGARSHADKMFLRHTLNAGSLYKAAAIYAAAGDNSRAAELKQQAILVNPQQDELITRSLARR
jgi:tetratricopeptide (TPR) repeat protein